MSPTVTILLLAGAYAVIVVLLVMVLLASSLPLLARAAVVSVGIAGMFVTYLNVGELRGWPSDTALPQSFQLLWGRVVEPDPVTEDRGHVFLWVEQLDESNFPSGRPRAYQLPYSPELASLVNGVIEELKAGNSIAGTMNQLHRERDTAERLAEDIEIEANGRADPDLLGERYVPFDFGDLSFAGLPTPVTPDKPE
ncbi:MAG TPA: hypothetical protein VFE52_11870 [Devosia sp.]|jgi:hypothetical protein|nr:hypothetical protein [Devosia sp.]